MEDLEGQVIVVTGAAGNLGTACSQALLAAGASLVLVDRSPDRLGQMHPDLAEDPGHWLATGIDLTSPRAIAEMADQVRQRFGRVDGLLNLAGLFRAGSAVVETDVETWDQVISVNARAPFLTARAFAPLMIQHGRGTILNVGARAGLKAGAGNAAFAAAKAAVLRLTESLSSELRGQGINVNAIIPGTLDTPENRESMPAADFSRWVDPEAVCDVILFLLSERARAIHGAILPVIGLS